MRKQRIGDRTAIHTITKPIRRLGGWVAVFLAAVGFLAGCGDDRADERSPTKEETKYVTQVVTVEETAPSVTTQEPDDSQERSPEDVLALQYEYINTGNFEGAYALFAEQSRREVSLGQYRAFFEVNAPYSVTDYSFSPAQVQGDSASTDVEFTVTSASGVERLQRTQEFVRENGEWRVVMRAEQVAAFTASDDAADTESPSGSPSEGESSPEKEKGSGGAFVLSGSGQTATEPFELEAGLSVFRMTHQGNRNFIVWLLDGNGGRVDLLVNEIRSFSGSKAVRIPRDGTYLLQVEADGPWTIQVEY